MFEPLRANQENIGNLLNANFFNVPLYQRRYVWQVKNVSDLFGDIVNHFDNNEKSRVGDNYLLGNVIAYRGDDDRYDIIDGQQRITTLVVLLCAIRDYLEDLGAEKEEIIQNILLPKIFRDGVKTSKSRLQVNYIEGKEFVDCLINGRKSDYSANQVFAKTLSDAYNFLAGKNKQRIGKEAFDSALGEEFGTDIIRINKFINHLLNNVSVVFVVAGDAFSALKIFETLNARGVGLASSDLIKNMIFSKIDPSLFEIVDRRWTNLLEKFNHSTKEFMMFLIDYVHARFSRSDIREENLYDFFLEKEVMAKYDDDCIRLVDDMNKYSGVYLRMFKKHQAPEGCSDNYRLKHINMLGSHRKIKLHYSLLLATYIYQPMQWDKMIKRVEAMILIERITGKKNECIKVFNKWRKETIESSSETSKDIETVMADIDQYIRDSLADVEKVLRSDTLEHMNRTVRKYILAKIYNGIENKALSLTEDKFSALMGKEVEVEHCLPQNPDDSVLEAFGIPRDQLLSYVWRLGNLMLLEKPNNRTCSNHGWSEKSEFYRKSPFLLNKAMVEDLWHGSKNQTARALSDINYYTSWNIHNMEDRSRIYRTILYKELQE